MPPHLLNLPQKEGWKTSYYTTEDLLQNIKNTQFFSIARFVYRSSFAMVYIGRTLDKILLHSTTSWIFILAETVLSRRCLKIEI